MRTVLYLAHPLAGDVAGNLARAMRWLAWARRAYPGVTIIAPWIAAIAAGEDDSDPAQREAGLVDAEAVIPRLDGVLLVGGTISPGMERERAAAIAHGRAVIDFTRLGAEPPLSAATALEMGARDRAHVMRRMAAFERRAIDLGLIDLGGEG